MPLWHFLYLCPECGFDPMEGKGDRAWCSSCGVRFHRDREGELKLARPDGTQEVRTGPELAEAIDGFGGPLSRARYEGGKIRYGARAALRLLNGEAPVRRGGQLLGYHELLDGARVGHVEVDPEGVSFDPETDGTALRWPLMELKSLQASSAAIQLGHPEHGLAEFRFFSDSPRRWEDLLARLIRDAWRRAGRGEIVEFQPRIVAR